MKATPIYLGYFLLGVVGALLGPILPELEARWQISHAEAAVLFVALFVASSVGSVLSTFSLRLSLVIGYPLMAAGLALLAAGSWATAPWAMALVGLGFGMCLPATNMIVAQANPTKRGAALSTLNMIWGLGAVSCPLLLVVAADRVATVHSLQLLAAVLLVVGFVVALKSVPTVAVAQPVEVPEQRTQHTQRSSDSWLLGGLALTLFFYVGSENAVAGWIVTLGNELGGGLQTSSLLLGSLFWGAQTLGRGLAPLVLKKTSERRLFYFLMAIAGAGVLGILAATSRIGLGVATVVTGLGLSAIFPLTVSRISVAAAGTRGGSGWIFALGGLGGATLPWLTGRLSGITGRIQTAFLVPLIGLALVALLGFLSARRQNREG